MKKKNYLALRPPSSGPFEYLWLDFIQLPLSVIDQDTVIIWEFFKWVEPFLWHKADALMVAKKLLENVFSTWDRIPLPLVTEVPNSQDQSYEP